MQVVYGHHNAPAWDEAAIAIGNFDGVHVGHRALISRARELAEANAAVTVALTFDPHPSALLAPARAPRLLTSIERRIELLGEAGVDAVVVEPFTHELAGIAPNAFVDDVVIFALRARAIIVGYDFSYGQGRTGTVEALRAHGIHAGIEVAVVPAVTVDGEVAASTKIRGHLRAGDLVRAARMLGRPWDVDGTVVHGAERGRALGIPTANIRPEVELVVAPGIYAVTLRIEGGTALPAVASLGTNPTFVEDGDLGLEVHVLDWSGDLYDRRVRTTFVARLRDERKFDSVDALMAQIARDIEQARAILAR
ncbi:MAG: bifunctional riboflavin kinase/FAD synthetase [Deltaproteobacteria bacterium]|nr:MAG: bifunctional riboflavin kinase/FAD synthetase [Deltaproteobacteria bacterium]TMQ12673.1 MAG: bifunctional riboflavin kinase/FAD synthetase [Deltaproteobacteria bacterium]